MTTETSFERPFAARIGEKLRASSLVRIVVASTLVILTSMAIWALTDALLGRDYDDAMPGVALLIDLLSAAIVLGVYYGYVRIFEARDASELSGNGALREIGFGVAIGALLFSATIAMLSLFGHYTVTGINNVSVLVPVLSLSIGAAVTEELLMRGIFFRLLERSLGTWIALALSALLFGLMHMGNPNATFWAGSAIAIEAGILLAAAYVYTRRLWLVIGLHFAWNFVQGGIFGVAISGIKMPGLFEASMTGPELLTGGAFGAEASIVAVFFCLSTGLAFLVVSHRQGKFIRPFWRRRDGSRAPLPNAAPIALPE